MMDLQSKESTFLSLSQGTMEAVMNGVNTGDLDMYFKHENLLQVTDCLHTVDTFNLESDQHLSQETFVFNHVIPDSTHSHSTFHAAPVSTGTLPSMEDYSGPCDFDVEVNRSSGDKAKWQFSEKLNKLYVIMQGKIPLKFKWNQSEYGLSVRVLPVFLAQDYFSEPVLRCPTHASEMEKSNKDFQHVEHIIRSDHPQALYEKNVDSERYSVLVPLEHPQPGTDWTTSVYTFMCKNSCILGMNRRSTGLIFTLERPNGEVLGRKMIKVRICSCPRRDMCKEEKDLDGKGPVVKDNDDATDEIEDNTNGKKLVGKKPLKRLSKDLVKFQITIPKSYVTHFAKILRQTIMMTEVHRELTHEEKEAVMECNKYID